MKRKYGIRLATIIGIILFFSACNKEKEDYYERPEWLEPPIYTQLEEKGNFSNYLKLVDKAGFKSTLSRSGYYTVFAPTDEAFTRFFQANGYTSTDDIDTLTAQGIVKYSICYNSYLKDKLDDYQNSNLDTTQRYDVAYKRRTMYYKWVFDENVEGADVKVVDQNGVRELPEQGPYFSPTDNNNKHLPYFTDNYFLTKGLDAYDYNYFFPDKEFTGFNVYNAAAVESDLRAENGVIHTVDEVITPLPNIEDYLAGNPDYSVFYDLIKQYMLEYDLAPESFLDRYAEFTGTSQNVYIKQYNLLPFAPNCENYMKYASSGSEHDAQRDSWTLFAPTNDATNDFINNKLLKHYPSIDVLSDELISEFINAHFFRSAVWPSRFESTVNYFGEPARFDPESNIVEKKIGSNGMFYGTDMIQRTDAFYTVLGEIILDPQYALMVAALRSTNIYDILKNPNLTVTVFLLNNDAFINLGLTYDGATNSWELNNESLGLNASLALSRIIKMNIILGKVYENFNGAGVIQTYGGEYIKYSGGQVYGAGNLENSSAVIPKRPNFEGSNGVTFQVVKPLYYSTWEIGGHIIKNQTAAGISEFVKYLEKADKSDGEEHLIYNALDSSISFIDPGEANTLLIPTDTAILAAVRDGYLPEIQDVNFTLAELTQVSNFIKYHCINGQIIVPGSGFSGTARNLYKTEDQPTFYLDVEATDDDLIITDHYNRDVHIIYSKSNILSNNAVIHVLDDYLKYEK